MLYLEEPIIKDERQFWSNYPANVENDQEQMINDDWHERMNSMYTYTDDGFFDVFTKY